MIFIKDTANKNNTVEIHVDGILDAESIPLLKKVCELHWEAEKAVMPLKVPIVVNNMPGGGGGIAAENVFRAPNDGYTWHAQGSAVRSFGVMGLHPSPPKDWYCLPTTTYVCDIAVREDSPYKTFADLIGAMKKEPGKIAYGASQPATAYRISMEIMARLIPSAEGNCGAKTQRLASPF